MADANSSDGTSSGQVAGEISDSVVNVNIKTLDSQLFTFCVNKNMPVRLFKEKIASDIHVPVEQQRLIFRGKVLKDDHLLSEYNLEDGDTLHLVARLPAQSQAPRGTGHSESDGSVDNRGSDSTTGASRNRIGQVSHSVVMGTFNIGDQGDGLIPDITRLIGAVLNSVGYGNLTATGGAGNPMSTTATNASSQSPQGAETEATGGNVSDRGQTTNQVQPGQNARPNFPFQTLHEAFQLPPARAVAVSPMVIPDSLTMISEFITRMELALSLNGFQSSSQTTTNSGNQPIRDDSSPIIRGFPTPEALSAVMRRARQLLSGHAGAALSHIIGRLEREGTVSDPAVRSQIQAEAMQVGVAMQHLGALLLELGRTILALRMGQSPAEGAVNAGPAVYISQSGPNPIMVQPQPFQTGSFFGAAAPVQTSAGILGPFGPGDVPRNINIHIHAGPSVAPGASPIGPVANTGETNRARENQNQVEGGSNETGSSYPSDSGPMRVLPMRTVVAAVPARPPAEATSHVFSVHYPHHARPQQTNTSQSSPAQGSTLAATNGARSNLAGTENSFGSTVPATDMVGLGEGAPALAGVLQASPREGSTDSSAIDVGIEGQQPELHPSQLRNGEDTAGSLSTKQAVSTSSSDDFVSFLSAEAVSAKSEVHPPENCSNLIVSETAPSSNQSKELPDCGETAPLGLGLGGLQPLPSKRRSRQSKPQQKEGQTSSATPINQNEQSTANGQRILQSLVSRGPNITGMEANGLPMNLTPVIGQIINGMPTRGQAADGQIDVESMMSQVLHSPALNNILEGVAGQAGGVSTSSLKNMLEQVTQSPVMRNTLNQIAEQVEDQGQDLGSMLSGFGSGQGGIDFSRMIQQLMPVVSQALSRGLACPDLRNSVEEPMPLCDDSTQSSRGDLTDDIDSQIDLQEAVQRMESLDPPGSVFRTVVESAVRVYGDANASDLVEEICNDDVLVDEFMKMVQRNIRSRLGSESLGSPDKS